MSDCIEPPAMRHLIAEGLYSCIRSDNNRASRFVTEVLAASQVRYLLLSKKIPSENRQTWTFGESKRKLN